MVVTSDNPFRDEMATRKAAINKRIRIHDWKRTITFGQTGGYADAAALTAELDAIEDLEEQYFKDFPEGNL